MRSAGASRSRPAAAELLAGAGLDRLDAELLLAKALGIERATLHADPRREVGPGAAGRFAVLAARRRAGEPVAYLLGRKGFRWIELEVDRRVLVPRPETEGLVEVALDLPAGARVVDVGTGSGAVALALKHERPDLDVVATDASADALEVARANATRLGLDVLFVRADLLDGVSVKPDAVLANLPYVAEGEPLPVDVGAFEPRAALDGGPDGLALIRRLVPQAAARAPFLALEVGAGQAAGVAGLCRAAGFRRVEARRDLAGIERIVVARAC
jgi:release factor glutamine methyltransferase